MRNYTLRYVDGRTSLIFKDHKHTGFGVIQDKNGTRVYKCVEAEGGETFNVKLPNERYALSCDKPASGNPGRAQFDADLEAALARLD
jgi:hypothetical protein